MQTKQLDARVTVKNADIGEVEAVFATLGVLDHDGDIILPGAIKDGSRVAISQYGHSVWKGNPPAGVGTIHEIDGELVMKGRYFLDTDHGRNDFHTVKGLAESGAGEWSFGLLNVSARKGTYDGVSGNLIDSVDVPEVSPVFIGAGISTRTTSVKGRKQLDSDIRDLLRDAGAERFGADGTYVYPMDYDLDESYVIYSIYADDEGDRYMRVGFTRDGDDLTLDSDETEVERDVVYSPKSGRKFSEHLASVLADVKALTTRADEVMALRAAKGKSLSGSALEALAELGGELERIKSLIGDAPESNSTDGVDVLNEYARFVANTQGLLTP